MPAKWTTFSLIVVLFLLSIVSGYNYYTRPYFVPSSENPTVEVTEVASTSAQVSSLPSAEDLASKLSIQEKIAQVLILPIAVNADVEITTVATSSASSSAIISDFFSTRKPLLESQLAFKPGAVLITSPSLTSSEVTELLTDLRATEIATGSSEPLAQPLVLVDHEGGAVQRLNAEGFSVLPSWKVLCSQSQSERVSLLAKSAAELKSAGIDVVLGPVIDTGATDSVLGSRICSSEATVVATAAGDYLSAFINAGVVPVLKHYPGIGATRYDLHKRFDSVQVDPDDIWLYKRLLDAAPFLPVLISHVGVQNQYLNIPCSLSSDCVQELTGTYPQVLTIADALDMPSARVPRSAGSNNRSIVDAALDAIAAGNSMIILGQKVTLADQKQVFAAVQKEYQTNATFASKLDSAVLKILALKLRIAKDEMQEEQ